MDEFIIEPYIDDPSLPSAIIVDIDGTIAQMSDRSPYDFSRVGEDTPVEAVIDAVRSAKLSGRRVILMSGRNESCRNITEMWLDFHLADLWDELHMRSEYDERKDDIVKYEMFKKYVEGKYHVKYVLDDRDQVVAMWRKLGLACFQVNYGDF